MGNWCSMHSIQDDFKTKKDYPAAYNELLDCLSRATAIVSDVFKPHLTHHTDKFDQSYEDRLREAALQIESLNSKNSRLQSDCTTYIENIEKLKETLESQKTTIHCQQTQIHNLQSEKELTIKYEDQHKEAKSKIETLNSKNSKLQRDLMEYNEKIMKMNKSLQYKETTIDDQQTKINKLQTEKEEEKAKVEEFQSLISSKESTFKSETLQLERKIKMLEDEIKDLKEEDSIKQKICKHDEIDEIKDIILRGALKEAGVSEAIVTCINKLFIKKLSERMKRNHFDVNAQVCSEPPLEVIDPFLVIGLKRARAEHDVENSLRGLPVSKVTGFVYVHMIGDKTKIDEIIPTKLSRFDLPPIADLVFHNTDGILDCEINQMALDTIAKWLASKWA